MAKLCRIHVAGMGREDARFNPLTVDLRNAQDGAPQDSVIWLRNGGGKTTLISIFYSLLVPNASQFLGKMNGKGASLEDFLRPDQLACVATEWDLSMPGTARRTVGQVLLLKDRRFIRRYFSFTAVPAFSFDTLPVNGLAPAARSLESFEEILYEAQRTTPALDLVIEEAQWRWEEHLANLGLDSALFRAHLIMNSQEGGATEIFKIKTPEEFVRKFLELVWDGQLTDEIETTLKLFRDKLAQNPSYRAAIEFGETILKYLRPFAGHAARRQALAQEQAGVNDELAQLAAVVARHLAALDSSIEAFRTQEFEFNRIADNKDKERQRKDRFARGYERRGRRLRVGETEALWVEATRVRENEERHLRVLKAAEALVKDRAAKATLEAALERLAELRRAHRPEMELVRQLGAALLQCWDYRIADLEADRELTQESIRGLEHRLEVLAANRNDQIARRTRAELERNHAQVAIRRYEEIRRKLKDDGALNESESGADARARWQLQAELHTAQLIRLREEIASLNGRATATASGIREIDLQFRTKEQQRTELETKLEVEARKRLELESLAILIQLAEGQTLDLRNPFLLESIDSSSGEAENELMRLAVESADDKRDDQAIEREGLFAHAVDVERVLVQLKRCGVTSALPVYRWLDEHCSPDKAAELLRRFPSIYAGILVQSQMDFERACREVGTAHIRTPVVVLSPHDLTISAGSALPLHTVLPEERGLFSSIEAATARPRLEQRRKEQAERQDRAQGRRNEAQAASTRLRDYLRDFPTDRLISLRDSLDSVKNLLASLRTEAERLRDDAQQIRDRLKEALGEQLQAQQNLGIAERRETQVNSFVTEHEDRIDEYRTTEEKQQSLFLAAEAELQHIALHEPALKLTLGAARNQESRLKLELEVGKTARNAVPEEYRGTSPAGKDPRSPQELEAVFTSARTAYEGKIQKGELEGAITVRRENALRAQADFDKLKGELPLDELERAAQEHSMDIAIERQRVLFRQAKTAETLAEADCQKARKEAPDEREFKEGEDFDRDRGDQPETAASSLEVAQEYRDSAAQLRTEIEEARKHSHAASSQVGEKEKDQLQYKNWAKSLPPLSEAPVHPAFTGVPIEDGRTIDTLLVRAKQLAEQLGRIEHELTQSFDKQIHPHIFQTGYDRFRIPFRDRLKLLHRDDFVVNATKHIQGIETHVQTCQSELNSEEQERRTIVEKLDGVARRGAALLGQAETVSAMPDSIGPWAQHPFLRAHVPKKNDLAERQVLLRQAIDRWFETADIPSGHKLAYECLLAVCGTKSISIRILKPEYRLSCLPRDITELVKFSDGEKLTAAILLYCVLVRLRARQKVNAEHILAKDSGMLLLDNPFGKATLAEFVDLQVRMARRMGVQLIYATGINDFAALKHFPHYVRLRNSSRGRTSSDHYVTPDPRPLESGGNIEGIVLGRSEQQTHADS